MTVTDASVKFNVHPQTIRQRIFDKNSRYRIYAKKSKRGKQSIWIIDVDKSLKGLIGAQKGGRKPALI